MPSVNQVNLIGHVTRDPQFKTLPSGTDVAEFGLAMNNKWTGKDGVPKEDVCFVDCSIFGKGATVINQYVTKGKALYVTGKLRQDNWEDKQGNKRSKLTVVVENFQFLGGRNDGEESQDHPAPARQQAPYKGTESIVQGNRQRVASRAAPQEPFGNDKHFQEADIPF